MKLSPFCWFRELSLRELNLQIPGDLLNPKEDGEKGEKASSPQPMGLSVAPGTLPENRAT